MKALALFLVTALAVTDIDGNSLYPRTSDQHDEATEHYWKQPLGKILEQLGKWLQQSAQLPPAIYSAEDAAIRPEDFTIEHIKKVAEMLNKVADAAENGEKVDMFD